MCFGDVFLASNKNLSSSTKCQTCVIIRKPCQGGVQPVVTAPSAPATSTIVVRPQTISVPPRPRAIPKKTPAASSSTVVVPSIGMVYDVSGAPLGRVTKAPTIDLSNPPLTRKRSALAPPTSANPPSAKSLRPSQSSSAIRRPSSSISGSIPLPTPLVSSPSLPLPGPSSSTPMVVDPPEDQMLILLDALEYSVVSGRMDDARKRIQALRKLREQELRGSKM